MTNPRIKYNRTLQLLMVCCLMCTGPKVASETIAVRCCTIENSDLRDFIKERVFVSSETIWPMDKDKILYDIYYSGGDSVYVCATCFRGQSEIPLMHYRSYPDSPTFITNIDNHDVVVNLKSKNSTLFKVGKDTRDVTGSSVLMLNDDSIEWCVYFKEWKITDVWSDYEYSEYASMNLSPDMYLLPNKSMRYYKNENIDWTQILINSSVYRKIKKVLPEKAQLSSSIFFVRDYEYKRSH